MEVVVLLRAGVRASRASSPPTATSSFARTGQAVVLTLADEIDASRGDVIAAGADPAETSDQFSAHLLWMDDAPLLPGRPYFMKIGARTIGAQVTEIKHKVDVNTQEELAAKHLDLNEKSRPATCTSTRRSRSNPTPTTARPGAFILIDRQTNATVAAGTLDFALRRAGNIHWHHLEVDKAARAHQAPAAALRVVHRPVRSGKSTIANLVEKRCWRWAGTPTCSTATTCATA